MELLTPEYSLIVWGLFTGLLIGCWIVALIDVFRSDFSEPSDKLMWAVIVLLLPFIGTVLYFTIGRKRKLKLNRY